MGGGLADVGREVFNSERHDWRTPQAFLGGLHERWQVAFSAGPPGMTLP